MSLLQEKISKLQFIILRISNGESSKKWSCILKYKNPKAAQIDSCCSSSRDKLALYWKSAWLCGSTKSAKKAKHARS